MIFSETVCSKLESYVYRLIDPRNGETFYVGVGVGNRVFAHVGEVSKKDNFFQEGQDNLTEKLDRIRDIRNARLDVLHVIHRHGMDTDTARVVEAALIDAYPGISNIQGGHGGAEFGVRSPQEIISFYDLPEVPTDLGHKLVIININGLENRVDRTHIYHRVRYAWRISADNARKANFVLAAVRGVCVGIFEAHRWLRADDPEFIAFGNTEPASRYGFIGEEAPERVWKDYVGDYGKKLAPEMAHNQNPIKYFGY